MSSLYVQGRNKNHHHSDDDGDEMANGNRTHKIHVCMLLSDTALPHSGPDLPKLYRNPKLVVVMNIVYDDSNNVFNKDFGI